MQARTCDIGRPSRVYTVLNGHEHTSLTGYIYMSSMLNTWRGWIN